MYGWCNPVLTFHNNNKNKKYNYLGWTTYFRNIESYNNENILILDVLTLNKFI